MIIIRNWIGIWGGISQWKSVIIINLSQEGEKSIEHVNAANEDQTIFEVEEGIAGNIFLNYFLLFLASQYINGNEG